MRYGDYYFLIDPETGAVDILPALPTDRSFEDFLHPNYVIPYYIPWAEWRRYGQRPTFENDPWYLNPDMRQRLRDNGLDPDEYILN